MFWVQGAVSFLAWIVYGVVQTRRSDKVRAYVSALPRTRLGLTGAALMLAACCVMFGAILLIAIQGGFGDSGMKPWAWALVTVIGLGFVHAMTISTAIFVHLALDVAVTQRARESSTKQDPVKKP